MKPKPKINGRPRALTLADLLEAAIDLGLNGISMTALAGKLNVAPATIYNYVASREELLRLAAQRQVERLRFDDAGDDWQDLIRAHARRFFEHYFAEPQMIIQHMQGLISPEVNFDYLDALLAALVKRGFSVDTAYQLYTAANFIVGGAIVRAAHVRTLHARGESPGEIVQRSLAARAPDALPYLRACTQATQDDHGLVWQALLERLIASFAEELVEKELSEAPS
jgi:AcrR family transcriptional regulator